MRGMLIVVFYAISLIASATEYYVKVGGNDNADGKSDATAWATVSKVNSASLKGGDIIYFRAGDRWRETLTIPSSGSGSAYIKFTRYGQGVNPKIVGSNAPTGWTSAGNNIWKTNNTFNDPKNIAYGSADIYFEYPDNSKKRGVFKSSTTGLTTEYNWTYSSGYIYVFSPDDPMKRYASIEIPQRWSSVYTNNQSYLHFDGIDFNYGAFTGIDGTTSNDVRDYTGCIVENSEISCIGGISPEQYGFGTNIVFSDMVIRNCLFYYCGRRAISMNMQAEGSFTVENVIIEKNTFKWGSHTTALDLTCNNGGSGSAGYNGIIFRYNLVEEEQDVAVSYPVNQIWFQNYSGTGSINNVYIYSNIFKYWRENCIATEGVKGNIYVYNNTFYENNSKGGSYGYSYGIYSDTDVSTFRMNIKNNIFYSTLSNDNQASGAFIVPYGINNSHYICNYNLFYRINNNLRVWFPNGTGYYMEDIAKVRSALGWEINSPTPSNPMFASSTDLHLLTASPALGKGVAIPEVEADFSGNAWSNPPNIGCYSSTGVVPELAYVNSVIQNVTPSILEMTYNLTLANIVPTTSAFTVQVNSIARAVNAVSISGTKVLLTLSSPVVYGDVVTVTYTKPATNPLQTSTGSQAASITAQAVTNNVATVIPVYVSSVIQNATPSILEMTYSLALANVVPSTSAFAVRVNSISRTVSSVSISGTKVSLTLSSPVVYGDIVTVAYTKPATNPLQTSTGGQAASITAQAVTNNVAIAIPVYVSSVIQNATPSVLEMTYSLALANVVPSTSAFAVRVNSITRTVNSVSISGTKVSLTLSSPVVYGDIVTVAYTKPTTNPLQTTTGGQAASITAQAVTNNVAAVIPVYVSSVIQNATPSVLEMTYSLTLANIVPATSAFAVLVNSVARTVSSVSVSGTKVSLTLSSPVVYGNVVTVTYTKPAANPIQTTSGGQAGSISNQPVINNCSPTANQPPVINISSPTKNSSFIAPATVNIDAVASDPDGTVGKVEFYNGNIKLGEKTIAPYSFTWKEVPEGTYTLIAVAIDNLNARTVSDPVYITVTKSTSSINQLPIVFISSKSKSKHYKKHDNVVIIATAEDPDGTVTKVELKSGNNTIAELTSPPYIYTMKDVDTGTYVVTAIATDNLGAVSSSGSLEFFVENYGPDSEMIDIYPNPNDGHFSIEIHSGLPEHNNRLRIVNISGRSVYDEIFDGNDSYKEFDLSGKADPGIYVVMLTNGNRIFSARKFIKR